MGIRGRIVTLASLAVAVAVIAASVGAYLAVRSELRGQVDNALRAQADVVRAIGSTAPPGGPGFRDQLNAPPDVKPILPGAGTSFQRVTASGRLAAVPQADHSPVPVSATDRAMAARGSGESLEDRDANGHHYRVLTVGVGGAGAVMLVRSLDGVDGVLANLRTILGLLILAGVIVAGLLALLVARGVIAPIARLSNAAEQISETSDLTLRVAAHGNDEPARLAQRFNSMLETLEANEAALSDSVASQRQLVADASHELRTPVSAIRTNIETLLAHPDLDRDKSTQILHETDLRIEELGELILDVIELARGDQDDQGDDQVDEGVRLDLVAADSIERLAGVASQREVVARLEPSVISARPDRLYRAINNLLDNAHKYSPPGRPIEVNVADGVVEVRDHGPGIPEADLPHVFDRFWRGSTSRDRPGSGLGLAIVRQVAEASGGRVEVDNLKTGGTRFRLAFLQ
jgi:two-component system sensor histidine kinase MprB